MYVGDSDVLLMNYFLNQFIVMSQKMHVHLRARVCVCVCECND